ncbi:MAG: DUF1573 domain-containing protein [Bacteroidetes bacterium]|nr:DUF1573 domain-containing protein [Bacteroidota bacterium]
MSLLKSLSHLCFLLFFIILSGCQTQGVNNESQISADVVNNPNSASGSSDKGVLPVIKFEETEHDFGRILEGETVSIDFSFTNSGKSDLLLAEASASCGCTIPSYPKAPIRPGEKGIVKVTFNSQGRRGFQTKNIIVVSNTQPNTTILRIKAQVVNPAGEK